MKEQRWPGDYERVSKEFSNSKREEQMGMRDANASHGNDYITQEPPRRLDQYQTDELEASWSMQLDTNGMQPHSREYLERDMTGMRSARKFTVVAGEVINHCNGIHFGDTP